MSRPGWNGRFATGAPRPAGLTLLIVMAAGGLTARAQQVPQPGAPGVAPAVLPPGSPS